MLWRVCFYRCSTDWATDTFNINNWSNWVIYLHFFRDHWVSFSIFLLLLHISITSNILNFYTLMHRQPLLNNLKIPFSFLYSFSFILLIWKEWFSFSIFIIIDVLFYCLSVVLSLYFRYRNGEALYDKVLIFNPENTPNSKRNESSRRLIFHIAFHISSYWRFKFKIRV